MAGDSPRVLWVSFLLPFDVLRDSTLSSGGLGSGEFLLIDESKPEEVKLVVRTINSSAFSNEDWKELVVDVR